MAFIGMRHPVVATLKAHTSGAEPTYNAGKVIGHAIAGNLTITRNNNPLYGDDVIVEDDTGITAMSLELGVDDIEEAVRVYMLGLVEKTSGSDTEYHETDASAPYVGVGYIRVRRKDGETKYQGLWYYKAIFSEESENSATKNEAIEWQTPTITGRVMGLNVGDDGMTFRKKKLFDSQDAAEAWLDGLAGITA